MTPTDKPAKTPAQAEKEAAQKIWEEAVVVQLNSVTQSLDSLDPKDIDTRAATYRTLRSLKDKIAQCSPAIRAAYNQAVDALFQDMDAIPGSMYLSEEEPKP